MLPAVSGSALKGSRLWNRQGKPPDAEELNYVMDEVAKLIDAKGMSISRLFPLSVSLVPRTSGHIPIKWRNLTRGLIDELTCYFEVRDCRTLRT